MTLIGRYPIPALILLWCLFNTVPAVPDQGIHRLLTLEQSIQRGLNENNKMKAAQSQIVQADQVRKQARSDFFPKVSTTYGYKKTDEPETLDLNLSRSGLVRVDLSTTDNFQWTGAVTQPLFKGFGIVGNYRLASLGLDRAKTTAALEKIDLALEIKQAYFNVLIADKEVEVADQAVASLKAHVETARNFYELEMISVNELLKAEVQLGNTEYELIKAVKAGRQSRAALNTLLAFPIDAAVTLEDILAFAPAEIAYDVFVAEALRQRPEIQSLHLGILQMDQQIRIARSKMYPEIGLQYRYIKEGDSYDVSGSQFHDADRWEFSAVMSWIIWEWGKTRYGVDENKSKRDELLNLKAALEDTIRLEIKTAVLKLGLAETNIPKAAKSVDQGKENLRVALERFDVQAGTSADVLDAQSLLTQAQLNYYRAIYDHNLAKAELRRALGTY